MTVTTGTSGCRADRCPDAVERLAEPRRVGPATLGEVVLAAALQNGSALRYAALKLKKDPGFIAECLSKSDSLPFQFDGIRAYVFQPGAEALRAAQTAALERIGERGDHERFFKHARLDKALWGDAELIFGEESMNEALTRIKAAEPLPPLRQRSRDAGYQL